FVDIINRQYALGNFIHIRICINVYIRIRIYTYIYIYIYVYIYICMYIVYGIWYDMSRAKIKLLDIIFYV
ncbi:MAG: hypothetical protein N7Q72_04720, partial [Spiroplasma sp. Tabriz.8]|nr:hypothetical protein [Spiroplasma sp. Tabriz.8]